MRKNKQGNQNYEFSILTLDDDKLMTLTLQSYFNSAGYNVDTENDPVQAIELVRKNHYDILLLDFLMTPMCGDEVVAKIREFNSEIYIILLTGHKSLAPPIKTIRELDIQGYYEKSDRFEQLELLVESCVKSIRQLRTINSYKLELEKTNRQLKESFFEVVEALRTIVDAKDIYTRGHSDRVANLSALIAKKMGRDSLFTERVALAGLFHDIGKIGVPDEILLKSTGLSADEYSEIKKHSSKGKEILSGLSMFDKLISIVESHHEWYDGNGYPNGLAGEAIPEEARIICVADAFDAMTSKRRYRDNLTVEQAVCELKKCRGTQFDSNIVDVFIDLLKEYNISEDSSWILKIPESGYDVTKIYIYEKEPPHEKIPAI